MASAEFTINGATNPGLHVVAYNQFIELALVSTHGISTCSFAIVGVSKSDQSYPAITLSGTPFGTSASFRMPVDPGDGLGRSFLIKATAITVEGRQITSTGLVGAANSLGGLPVASGEKLERDGTHGWIDAFNLAPIAAAPAFTSLGDTPGSYSGAAKKAVKVNAAGLGLEFVDATVQVTSYAGLRDVPITALSDGETATVTGRTTAGDGGFGTFRAVYGVTPGTYADDAGITLVPTGGDGSSAWIRCNVREVNALWYGDDGAAINAALTAAKARAIGIYTPGSLWETDETIVIPTDWPHVWRGDGHDSTMIRLADLAECNLVETESFATWTGTNNMPLPSSGGAVHGFTIRDMTLDGNRDNNWTGGISTAAEGRVLNLFARRYSIKDIIIQNAAGIGYWSEGAAVGEYAEDIDFNYGGVRDVSILECSYEGFVWAGPADVKLDNVLIGKCHSPTATTTAPLGASLAFPGESIDGFVVTSFLGGSNGTVEIGNLHCYGCREGYCVRLDGSGGTVRIRGDNITAEGGIGSFIAKGALYGNIRLNSRNNEFGLTPRPHIQISHDPGSALVYEYVECRLSATNNNVPCVVVDSENVTIGIVKIVGNGNPADGLVFTSNAIRCQVAQVDASLLNGVADSGARSRALWTQSGCDQLYIGQFISDRCDYGWRNDTTNRVHVDGGVIRTRASLGNIGPIDFASTPDRNYLLPTSIMTDTDSGLGRPRFSGLQSADATLTTEQTLTYTHNLWWGSLLTREDCSIQFTSMSGTTPTVDYLHVFSVSATQVQVRVKFAVAGTGNANVGLIIGS